MRSTLVSQAKLRVFVCAFIEGCWGGGGGGGGGEAMKVFVPSDGKS